MKLLLQGMDVLLSRAILSSSLQNCVRVTLSENHPLLRRRKRLALPDKFSEAGFFEAGDAAAARHSFCLT